ncbi:MAG: hypothetical protein GY849_05890, partial [Deltaproteobacteria bacterium]|nr:hypothetical protein [Deltaproteobacteria bacterium]
MQKIKVGLQSPKHKTGEYYRTWQDLADERPSRKKRAAGNRAEKKRKKPLQGYAGVQVQPELQKLIKEKDQLEHLLKTLTGKGGPDPEQERLQKMFPFFEETEEGQAEKKRFEKRDKRLAEDKMLLRRKEDQEETAREAALRKRAIEELLIRKHKEFRADLSAEMRRRRIIKALLQRHMAERKAGARTAQMVQRR